MMKRTLKKKIQIFKNTALPFSRIGKLLANKNLFICLFLLVLVSPAFSQEKLVELSSESLIKDAYQKSLQKKKIKTKNLEVLTLPFVDDFSNYTGYPNENLWSDNHAFVNQSYAINPPTVGVVTLDALDHTGNLYPQASTMPFAADTLTSHIIRLDSIFLPTPKGLTPADSIYLSFYFQSGGGYGNAWERTGITPSYADSLLLEFYNSTTKEWDYIWSQFGIPLDSLLNNNYGFFKYVLIPVVNENYFTDSFQFRFRNYCTLDNDARRGFAGNCDQWHIDYVRLATGRNAFDTTYRDIAFVNTAPSMLSKYAAMPAKQFNANEVKDSLIIQITNLAGEPLSSQYQYQIFDEQKNEVYIYEGGFSNISPFLPNHQYQTNPVHATPRVEYKFPSLNGQEQTYTVTHIVKEGTTTDNRAQNDTITFEQVFKNYYAYDDGTAENGYGLVPIAGLPKLAYRFVMNVPDTLTSVDIYFNRTAENGNDIPFHLIVWANTDEKPTSILYRSSEVFNPKFNGLNQYGRYLLDKDLFVNGTIYIGFEQTTLDFINIGFDRNNNASENIFYNTNGNWIQSFTSGALMMRPNFGAEGRVGEKEITINTQQPKFKIFPNPVSDGFITIQNTNDVQNMNIVIKIYNMLGVEVFSTPYREKLDISMLQKGVYLLQILDNKTKQHQTCKLIIAK